MNGHDFNLKVKSHFHIFLSISIQLALALEQPALSGSHR